MNEDSEKDRIELHLKMSYRIDPIVYPTYRIVLQTFNFYQKILIKNIKCYQAMSFSNGF